MNLSNAKYLDKKVKNEQNGNGMDDY